MAFFRKTNTRTKKNYGGYKKKYNNKVVNTVRKVMMKQTEFKKNYVSINNSVCDTTGQVNLLNGISRGDDQGERDGRQIEMTSINIRGFTEVTSGTGIDQHHRIMLVLCKNPNGTAPAITDILQSVSIQSLRNRVNLSEYKVLMDRTFTLNASAESGSKRFWKFYKKMYSKTIFNAGNAGTIADIEKGALYLITLGSIAAGVTAGVCTANAQICWKE